MAQLNDSLQQLAGKVSAAVVQIEVAGFGPAIEGDRKDTMLIIRSDEKTAKQYFAHSPNSERL